MDGFYATVVFVVVKTKEGKSVSQRGLLGRLHELWIVARRPG